MTSLDSTLAQIRQTESNLAQYILRAKQELSALYSEKRALEEETRIALGAVAPIRKLPAELLRLVFIEVFDTDNHAGWTFARVSVRWRNLALETPALWTRIRLFTKLDDSPDVLRLWMERAGNMPLDIEIYLRVPQPKAAIPADCGSSVLPPVARRSARRRVAGALLEDSGYSAPIGNTYESFGHVAVFYLKEQMHRWKRFIFRYDRVFSSLSAFKGISGNAPILEEFEISSIEPSLINFADWPWLPNAPNVSLPVLSSLSLTNIPVSISSSLLAQPLRTLYISALPTTPIQVGSLLQTLAKHAPTLRNLALNIPSMMPPVVPQTTLPYTSNTPLCLPVLEELSLGGHSLMAQLASAIQTPSLEELNVDIDLGRGGMTHGMAVNGPPGVTHFSYIEDIVNDLLNRGSPAPADKLKALSIAFGFGNGRRATRDREADLYLRALKSAQACTCTGSTFLAPGHPSSPSTPSPSVVHISWQFLGHLHALESLKVGLGGVAGPAWSSNGNQNPNTIAYQGGNADIEHFLSALCIPDEDFVTGSASVGIHAPPGIPAAPPNTNVVTFTVGFPHMQNTTNNPGANVHTFIPPPPIQIGPQTIGGTFTIPPFPPPPPPAATAPWSMNGGGFVGGGAPGFGNHSNGWLLPNLTELGLKVGSAAFTPPVTSGQLGLFSTSSLTHPYPSYPSMSSYSSAGGWGSSLDDPSGGSGGGYVRRLLDLIEGRNPKTGRGPNIDGVVPERLKNLELVLNVTGVPGRGSGHSAGLFAKGKKDSKGKKKAESGSTNEGKAPPVGFNVQDIVNAVSAAASGSPTVVTKEKSSKVVRNSNATTARTLFGADSVAWVEERIEDVGIRCECVLGDGVGMPRVW